MKTQAWYFFQLITILLLILLNFLTDRLFQRLYPRYDGWKRQVFRKGAILSVLIYLLMRTPVVQLAGAEPLLKYFTYVMVIWHIAIAGILLSWPLCWLASRVVREDELQRRRHAFTGLALGVCAVLAVAVALGGVIDAEARMVVRRKTLQMENLPPALSGLKVVQLTDTHLGRFFDLNRWDKALQLIQNEQPDLLLLTGDIVDDLEQLPAALDKLAELRSDIPLGIYVCLGNHEYFRDISAVRRSFAAAGIPVLSNENRPLIKENEQFYLLGADYPLTRDPAEREALVEEYMEQAMAGASRRSFRLLMAHHPDFIDAGFRHGIPLTMTGHTHGGQFGWGERSLFEGAFSYTRGLYRQGDFYGFVSSGAGHWLPFRLNCPPEIVVFTLMRE